MRDVEKRTGTYMSRHLITLNINDSLQMAYDLMKERRFRHLPVVNELGDVIGILSDRDLQRALAPQYDKDSPREMSFRFDPSFSVKDFMSWPVQKVRDETLLVDVARRMVAEKVSAFLVENELGHVDGIITTDDLLKVLIAMLTRGPSGKVITLKGAIDEYALAANH